MITETDAQLISQRLVLSPEQQTALAKITQANIFNDVLERVQHYAEVTSPMLPWIVENIVSAFDAGDPKKEQKIIIEMLDAVAIPATELSQGDNELWRRYGAWPCVIVRPPLAADLGAFDAWLMSAAGACRARQAHQRQRLGAAGEQVSVLLEKARRWMTLDIYLAGGGLRAEHRKLLAHLKGWRVNYDRRDGVSLYVEGKRPFGSSGTIYEIANIIGQPPNMDEDGEFEPMRPEAHERLWTWFDQLPFAMIDLTRGPVDV